MLGSSGSPLFPAVIPAITNERCEFDGNGRLKRISFSDGRSLVFRRTDHFAGTEMVYCVFADHYAADGTLIQSFLVAEI